MDPLAGSESPGAKKRQKSKLNYLLRYCPPAVGLPENAQPAIISNGSDLTRAAASPGGQAVSPMPALMLSMPPGVIFNGAEPKSPRAAAALPMIKVKKKHDLYGKNSSKRCTTKAAVMMDNFRPASSQQLRYHASAVWPSEGRAAAAGTQSSLDADEIAEPADVTAANLFPVGRQVKFRIFDWKSAAKSAAADQPNPAPIQQPLLQWLPETRAAPAAATIPRPPFGGYDIVKSEPLPMEISTADYHHTAFTRHSEAVNRHLTAERHTAVGGESRPALVESHPTSVDLPRLPADPEFWRQLQMHQFKREVLVDQPSFSYKNSSDLFMPQNLTSSGGSGSCSSDSGGSSTHSSRSNSCQLPNMDEEEEEEEGCEQPLDFSLPALCAAGVGATGALSPGRKYSVGATGALSPGRRYSAGATGALSPGRKYSAGSATVAISPCRKFSMSATEAQNPGRKYSGGATEAPSPGRKYSDGATEALSPGRKYSVIMNLWNR